MLKKKVQFEIKQKKKQLDFSGKPIHKVFDLSLYDLRLTISLRVSFGIKLHKQRAYEETSVCLQRTEQWRSWIKQSHMIIVVSSENQTKSSFTLNHVLPDRTDWMTWYNCPWFLVVRERLLTGERSQLHNNSLLGLLLVSFLGSLMLEGIKTFSRLFI